MEQNRIQNRKDNLRMIFLLITLFIVDVIFVVLLYHQVMASGNFEPSVLILFGFEYTVLASTVIQTAARYVFYVIEVYYMAGNWRNKGIWSFYIEMFCDVIRLITYLTFFAVVFVYYGLPIHLIRDLYMSLNNLRNRFTQFMR